jgi:hypothetical protein
MCGDARNPVTAVADSAGVDSPFAEKLMNPTLTRLPERETSLLKLDTFSDRLRIEQEIRESRRERHRAEQCNTFNSPERRIYEWEQLHGLKLPLEPSHPLLMAVVKGTQLSIAQIRDEQSARAALGPHRIDDQSVDLNVYKPKDCTP